VLNPAKNPDKDKRLQNWATAAIAGGIALRLLAFAFSSDNGGDSFARIGTTAVWLQHPSFRLDFALPEWAAPFHFWLMAALSQLVGDVTLGSRLLSLVFGCLSVWLVYRIARDIYDEFSAVCSVIVFALYSLAVGYSATASSEAAYMGLVLAGLLGFFCYRKSGRLLPLALAGLALTVDAGIRFESWVFIALLSLLLLAWPEPEGYFSAARLRSLAVFGFSAGLWPVFWMIHEWREWGNPLYFLSYNGHSVAGQQLAIVPGHASLLYQVSLLPLAVALTLTPFVAVAALYGMALVSRNRNAFALSLVILAFGIIELHAVATHESLALARYSITLGTLLALPAGYGLKRFSEKYLHWSKPALAGALLVLMGLNLAAITAISMSRFSFTDKFRAVSPLLQFPQHVEQVSEFLRPRLQPSDPMLIDDYNEEANIIEAALGLPIIHSPRDYSPQVQPTAGAANFIATERPRYIIYSNRGKLRKYISFPGGCPALAVPINGVDYRCVFQGSVYNIYEIATPKTEQTAAPQNPVQSAIR
jgi:Dolichyl-phosphate-mannose-protein mannosyltransferase